MQKVAARELKNRLGRYLKEVRRGRSLVITDRGKPVAQLSPVSENSGGETELLAILKTLETQGKLRLPTGPLRKFRPLPGRGKSASQMIIEDRR